MWTVQWRDNEPREISTLNELNRALDELEATHNEQNPVLVQVRSPAGVSMLVGVGGQLSVLDHIAAGGWPAQHSVGEPTDKTIKYMMGTYYSEMPKSYAIPRSVARKAVEHFFSTEGLLPDVTWESD